MFNLIGDISKIINIICFLLAFVSIISYYKSIDEPKWRKWGRISFHSVTIGIIMLSFFLLVLIINHQYQYTYIFHNSSNDLPIGLLLSTFYAGQEGSFLLWTLILVVIGIFLMRFSEKNNCEPQVMGTYAFVLSFLILIIMNKSPFEKVWETFPEAIRTGAIPPGMNTFSIGFNSWIPIPPDGNGLNPLLQNFWMQIHPPILFIGFALMTVPFVFAIAALLQRDYQNWINKSLPWILLSSTVLGVGIILGGFWAYETLGWGGYWGWDPVENSSLIPWIVSVALVHTAHTQRKTGGLIKTNLFLAIISFVLVVYSTFLTRSGVLQDSSVHSFTEPGTVVYLLLLIFLLVFLTFGIGLLLYRLKDIKKIKSEFNLLSREVALSIGSILLLLSALIILIGTSYPIISKSNVDTSFYNNWNLPLAILMLFFNGYSLTVKWGENEIKEFIKKSAISLLLSIVFTFVSLLIGVKDIFMLILVWGSLFSFFLNMEKLIRVIRGTPSKMGAFVSHAGFALLFLGIIGSGKYSITQNIQLPLNKSIDVFGYNLTYLGQEPFDNGRKTYFNVKIEKDGKNEILKPIMFFNQSSNGTMRIPDIKFTIFKDIYLSPNGLETAQDMSNNNTFEIEKGKLKAIDEYKVSFLSYNLGEHSMDQMRMGGEFTIGAKFLIEYNDKTIDSMNLTTRFSQNEPEYVVMKTKDNKAEFSLLRVISSKESPVRAQISFKKLISNADNSKNEILLADVSIKPFILLFWLGNIIMTLGFIVAIIRRWKELKN